MPELGTIDAGTLGFITNPNSLIRTLVFLALGVAGLVFFVMLVIGGFRYLTAGGDEKAAAEGQKTLTRAFIGLVIIIAAVLIVQLVIRVLRIPGTTVG